MAKVTTADPNAGYPDPDSPDADIDTGAELRARARRSVGLLVVLAVSVVVADLVSKLLAVAYLSDRDPVEIIPNVFDIRMTRNSGAAFSLAGGATVALSLVALAVVAIIVRTARRLRSRWWAVVLGLLAGGAVGNLTDRIFRDPGPFRGHVVDWIHITHWPVFNVADSAISVGAVLAVALSFLGMGLDGRRIGSAATTERTTEQTTERTTERTTEQTTDTSAELTDDQEAHR